MNFKNPYFNNIEKIELLQRTILIHSYLYYELNENILSDANYNANTKQLLYLKKKFPEEYKKSRYYKYFKDFESGTGFDLYSKIEKENDKDLIYCLKKNVEIILKKI